LVEWYVNPPGGIGYGAAAPPDMSKELAALGPGLVDAYRKGQMQRPIIDPRTGQPVDLSSTDPDTTRLIMQELSSRGGAAYVGQLLPYMMLRQGAGSAAENFRPPDAGVPVSAMPPAINSPHAAGPANIVTGQAGQSGQAMPPQTVAGLALRLTGGREIPGVVDKVASSLNIAPDDPITDPAIARSAVRALRQGLGRGSAESSLATPGRGETSRGGEDVVMPTKPTSAQEANFQLASYTSTPGAAGGPTSGVPAPQTMGPETASPATGIAPQGLRPAPGPQLAQTAPGRPPQATAGPAGGLPTAPLAGMSPADAMKLARVWDVRAGQARQAASETAAAAALPGGQGISAMAAAKQKALLDQASSYSDIGQKFREYALGVQSEQSKAGIELEKKRGELPIELTKKQQEEAVTRFGKKYDAITTAGAQADDTVEDVRLSQQLVRDPNFVAGIGQPYFDIVKRLGAMWGDPYAASPSQVFDKVRAASILQGIKGMAGTGPVRVAEMRFIEHMIAGRENSPTSLMMLLETERRVAERMQVVRDMAADYKGGYLDAGFDKMVAKYKAANPLFSEDEMKNPRLLAGGLAGPTHYESPAEIDKAIMKGEIKADAPFITPAGPGRMTQQQIDAVKARVGGGK
jgi:hypothetical protein